MIESMNRQFSDFWALSRKILDYAIKGIPRIEFLKETSRIVLNFSGCDAVEFRVAEGPMYYRFAARIHPEESFKFEILPVHQNKKGEFVYESPENTVDDKLFNNLFSGNLNPAMPFFTKHGSFWTGNAQKDLKTLAICGEQNKTVFEDSCQSMAMIPFIIDEHNRGVLQLKCKSSEHIKPQDIELYEQVGQILGVSIANRRAQAALRERVKELICLYGIAGLVSQLNLSLDGILQGIADLLPPAFQYPDFASGRIVLDGKIYSTVNFTETDRKLYSDIFVRGEKRGMVEVFYTKTAGETENVLFLKEEQSLLDTIARQIAVLIERRYAEDDRIKLQEQLRHADRLATIGQLSAGVAHEINEPLSDILGFAQLSAKCPGLPAQASQDIEKIIKASLHTREVIRKLMLFARQMPIRKSSVNINQVVQEGLYFLESRCQKEGVRLIREIDPKLPDIVADHSQLHQVIVNLVVNAIQAMPSGGVLTVRTEAANKYVLLTVSDTGIGMSEEIIKKVFIPFFTTKEVGQGTGLGLSVVHGIVAAHGGSIKVKSAPDKGTCFEVSFPIDDLTATEGEQN
jgi:signal transduction histidine kinase